MQPATKLEPKEKPKSQKFSLRTPYMKQGRITQLVAETENMWIHTKINYEAARTRFTPILTKTMLSSCSKDK